MCLFLFLLYKFDLSLSFPGLLPVVSIGVNQLGRLNLGRQVDSLQYFTVCGLQEGYKPFAYDMSGDPTLWMSWKQAQFTSIQHDDHSLQVSSVVCGLAAWLKAFYKMYFWIGYIKTSFGLCVECSSIPRTPNSYLKNNVQISFKVTRVRGSADFLSSLRVSQRLLAHHGGGCEMGFYRLGMPIECAAVLRRPAEAVLPVTSNSVTPSSGSMLFHIFN